MGIEQETVLLIVELRNLATKELANLEKGIGSIGKGMGGLKSAMGTAASDMETSAKKIIGHFGNITKASDSANKTVSKNLTYMDKIAPGYSAKALGVPEKPSPGPSPSPKPTPKKGGEEKSTGTLEGVTSGIKGLVGAGLGIGAGAGVFELAKGAMDAANEWENSMVKIANAANIPTAQVKGLGDTFQAMGAEGPTSAMELAQAFGSIAGEVQTLGLNFKDTSAVKTYMKAVDDLSLATGEDLGTATKQVTDTLKVFHMDASKATDVTNDFYNTARLTGEPVSQIASEMARLQPRLQGSGLDVDHFSGLIKQMSDQMGSGRASIMMVTSAVTALTNAKPGSGAGKELEKLGIQLDPTKPQDYAKMMGELQAKFKNFKGTPTGTAQEIAAANDAVKKSNQAYSDASSKLADLQEKAKTSGGSQGALKTQIEAAQRAVDAASSSLDKQGQKLSTLNGTQSEYQALQAIFGKQAAAMMPIINGQTESLDQATAAVTKKDAIDQAAANTTDSYAAKQKQFQNVLQNLKISVGQELIPIFINFMNIIQNNMPEIKKAIEDVIKVLKVIGDVVKFVSDHWKIFKPIVEGVVLAFIGMKAAKFVSGLFKDIHGEASKLIGSAKSLITMIPGLGNAFKGAGAGARDMADGEKAAEAANPFGALLVIVTTVVPLIIQNWSTIVGFFKGLWDKISGPLTTFWNWLKTIWNDIKNIPVDAFNFIKDHLNIILPIVLGILMGPFGLFLGFILTHLSQVKQIFVTAWNDIRDFFTKTIPAIIGDIVGFFGRLPGQIVTAIGNLGKWIWDHAIHPAFDFVKGLANDAIQGWIDIYIKLPIRIIQGLANFGGRIWGFLTGELGSIGTQIAGWITTVVGFFTGLPDQIIAGIRGIAKKFGDIGKAILDDILQGIKNAGGDVVNLLGDVPLIGPILKAGGGVIGGIISHIPGFGAEGGIVTRSTLAVIGEAGPEAVVPLHRMPGASALPGRGTSGSVSEAHFHFDLRGAVIADDRSLDALIKKMGYRMATHTMPTSGFRNVR